ncbi:hypothetical protein RB614_32740 [Phytohabitans sp. ZYX-F-186]|uniref:SCP2 domain-containing protein n=1 Tax=Phytohabitans maris TaxID=3071409 RepID=A0ABU0ZQI9_9ACTN|nr:hypothetical protein [Phytohabitans sp. ZYX-F-186]MDQ7909299.1 hypothetical protein [Phytohabitans sp. ZYX-F-186]
MSERDDDALMAELRRIAAEVDPVPPGVLEAARAAIATRHLDHELAELVADSADAGSGLLFEAVRGPGAAESRLLTFDGGGVQVDVDLEPAGSGLRLIGQFTGPVTECGVERGDGGSVEVDVDELGRFVADGVPPGPIRLRYRSEIGQLVRTAWLVP